MGKDTSVVDDGSLDPVNRDRIVAARAAGAGVVKHTPTVESGSIGAAIGGRILLKVESLQRTGSFKIRGAMNKLHSLGEAASAGVTAGSAGNHAQAIAFAAQQRGLPCEIFVPAGASLSKIEACRGFGATIVEGGESLDDAVTAARARAAEASMAFCHPFDDPAVVAGQGTLGLELLEDIADLSQVIVPLGGGGLAAGTAIAVKEARPEVRVVGVQVSSCAPYAGMPAGEGAVVTLADGIAVKRPGRVTKPLVEKWLDDVVVVDEDAIADAMMFLAERAKLYVEGGGAVGVSALLAGVLAPSPSGSTCVVLSGGNVDLGVVPSLIRRHETRAGRRLILFARIPDRPGGLARLLTSFASAGANLIAVEHVREGVDLHVRETGVQIVLEIRGPDHEHAIFAAAEAAGCAVSRVTRA